MKKLRSIKFNFIMNAMLSLSSVIFPMISFPYVSRVLMPAGIGEVSFVTSVVSYFSMIAMLGVPVYGIRACAIVRDDKEALSRRVQEIFIINVVMGIIAYVALALSVWSIPQLGEYSRSLFVVLSFTIGLNVIGVEWLYKALEQYSYITFRSLLFKFIALVLMFLLVRDESDFVIYGAITVLSSVGSYVFNFINLRKYINIRPMGGYNFRQHYKMIIIFFAMTVATTIYTNLDTVMLGVMKDKIDVGYYNAAVKIKSVLVGIVTSLGTVLMPRVSYYISNNRIEEFRDVTKKALNFVFLLAVPVTLFFMIFASNSIYLVSGPAYSQSVSPMIIIMPTVFLIGITNILGIQILIPMKRELIVLYSECIGALVDLILNMLLIPRLSASGAAIGTLVAELAVLIVQYVALRDIIRPMLKEIQISKIFMAIILSIISVMWIKKFFSADITILLIASVLFFGIYGVVLLITKEKFTMEVFRQFSLKR